MLLIRNVRRLTVFGLLFCGVITNTTSFASSPSITTKAGTEKHTHVLPAFQAQYNILRQSEVVGKASRTLSYLDNNQAKFEFKSKIKWFIFSDKRIETSIIEITDNSIKPLSFEYLREGTGSDKNYKLSFESENNKVTDVINKEVISTELPANIQDQLSHHLTIRQALIIEPSTTPKDFSFNVMKASGKLKEYVYTFEGKEEIMLPYGLVKTIKFKQENEAKDRATYIWLAPELDYTLVKFFQTKNDIEQFETQLTKLTMTP